MAQPQKRAISRRYFSTTWQIPGFQIIRPCGVVTGECVLGINVFRDWLGAMRDVFGGRSKTHEKTLRQAKDTAFREMGKEALALGGNAVVGVDLDYSEVTGGGKSGMLLLVVSGTAVQIKAREGASKPTRRR